MLAQVTWEVRMPEPVGITCPDINLALKLAQELLDAAVAYAEDAGDVRDARHTHLRLVDLLEKLRTANEKLREWGKTQESRAEDLEECLKDASDEKEDLEDTVTALEARVADLSVEVASLQTLLRSGVCSIT